MVTLNYWGGYRYRVKASSLIASYLASQEAILLGVNPLILAPILTKNDTNFKGAIIPSNMVSGNHSRIKLFDSHHGKFAGSLVPSFETLRQGRVACLTPLR